MEMTPIVNRNTRLVSQLAILSYHKPILRKMRSKIITLTQPTEQQETHVASKVLRTSAPTLRVNELTL